VNCWCKTFNNLSLSKSTFGVIVTLLMNRHCGGIGCKSQALFYLRFQCRMRELLSRHHSAAEGFGPAWEATLEDVPLEDAEKGDVYRQLIDWARSDSELFTGAREGAAWRNTV
jgi:hypothetical protein